MGFIGAQSALVLRIFAPLRVQTVLAHFLLTQGCQWLLLDWFSLMKTTLRHSLVAGLAIVSCYTAINAVVKAELFPTSVRALGVGLPYALTVALFGGTAEYVALWLKQAGRETDFFW